MTECTLHDPAVRLLGRLDSAQQPVCFDWTASGFETVLRGSELWAELESTDPEHDIWAACYVDDAPVSRFLVEPGRRWYPLVRHMSAELSRRVSLVKETQPMPHAPASTLRAHGLRHDGELSLPPAHPLRIEFIGDSLSSAEGALAPKDNSEWLSMWFTATGNYSFYCCRALNAERRVLSQSGRGVYWDYTGNRQGNMQDDYETVCGVLRGDAPEARGCQKPYDFASWPADVVCIRLLSNDASGLRARGANEENTRELISGASAFLKKVRLHNPGAYILWILPASDTMPELGVQVVNKCVQEGMDRVSCFALPDYGPEDMGARNHPNAAYNARAGLLLAQHLKQLLGL